LFERVGEFDPHGLRLGRENVALANQKHEGANGGYRAEAVEGQAQLRRRLSRE